MSPQSGSSVDGYSLIRKIGEGGFGEVWLSKSETTGAWKALKWISKASHRHLEQELDALSRYAKAISGARSPHLVPIEHVRLLDEALIYVMPLADGFDELNPDDPEWEPVTLSAIMARHTGAGSWFSLDEIKTVIAGVLQGASLVAQAGLQHRDIKPENVLFIGGEPALGDFGMATDDMTQVSMRGTPHHVAPSWYFESRGNSDQWGAAVLLYQLLTGNSPDKIGKPKYHKPAVGMGSLSPEQQNEWKRLQSLVNRATSEVPSERFQGFDAFKKALIGEIAPAEQRSGKRVLPLIGALFLVLFLIVYFWKHPWLKHPSTFAVAIPSSNSSTKRSAGKNEMPAILNQTNQPHNLSPEDVEQINQNNSSKAQDATDVAIKSLQETLDRLSNSKRTPVPDPTPK
jgi:serine/threonine protein kinase